MSYLQEAYQRIDAEERGKQWMRSLDRRFDPPPVSYPVPISTHIAQDFGRLARMLAREADEHTLWYALDAEGRCVEHFATTSGHDDTDTSDHRASIARMKANPHAAGVVLAHNHPHFHNDPEDGGRATPSEKDRTFTAWVQQRLGESGIVLIDHIVVGVGAALGDSVSFRESGLLTDAPPARAPAQDARLREAEERQERHEYRQGLITQLRGMLKTLDQLKEALRAGHA